MAIIHLGHSLPNGSSDLPENADRFTPDIERAAQKTFPYLVLHHEEFTRPHLLPNAPVRSYRTVSPITRSKLITEARKSEIPVQRSNWLVCFLLHLSSPRSVKTPTPGRYPARCPSVFGLSSG